MKLTRAEIDAVVSKKRFEPSRAGKIVLGLCADRQRTDMARIRLSGYACRIVAAEMLLAVRICGGGREVLLISVPP